MVTGKRLTWPNRYSTAATIRSRTSSPAMPPAGCRSKTAQSQASLPGHEGILVLRHQLNVLRRKSRKRLVCSSQEAHGFPITAVERKHNPHPLAVVTADLKAVGAPTPITFIHRNAAVMAALVPANVAIEQQTVNLHDPVDSLVIGRF